MEPTTSRVNASASSAKANEIPCTARGHLRARGVLVPWPGTDAKCPKTASIPSSIAPDQTLGGFGLAEFSARVPRPRFQAILMIFGGSKILEKNPGQANYSDASVLDLL